MSWPYLQRGRRQNPPIVFLHGFMGRGANWLPLVEPLAGHFYCLLPDLPGHGRNTQLPLNNPLNFDAVTDALFSFLHTVDALPASLVGYSLGGRLALYFAAKYPTAVSALVLEGASPGLAAEPARRERAALDDRRAAELVQLGLAEFVERWYQMELFDSLRRQPELLAQTKARRLHNDARWLAKIIRELSPGRQPAVWEQLAQLPMPVLLLAGALDAKFTALAGQMAARIPRAQVQIVPNAGHNVHLEQPAAFTHLLREFL